jgi:hypothetical protein
MDNSLTLEQARVQLDRLQHDADLWNAVQVRRAKNQLSLLEMELASMVERRPDRTPPFNVFSVLGLVDKEDAVSRMICWLANPQESHGVGVAFLEAFLLGLASWCDGDECVDVAVAAGSHRLFLASAQREVQKGASRADVVIDLPALRVVVETKWKANEGPEQTTRYQQAFQRTPRTVFVYLTPDGRKSEASRFLDVDYSLVFRSMKLALRGSCPTETRQIVEQFIAVFGRGDE